MYTYIHIYMCTQSRVIHSDKKIITLLTVQHVHIERIRLQYCILVFKFTVDTCTCMWDKHTTDTDECVQNTLTCVGTLILYVLMHLPDHFSVFRNACIF